MSVKKRGYITYQELDDIFSSEIADNLTKIFEILDIRVIHDE